MIQWLGIEAAANYIFIFWNKHESKLKRKRRQKQRRGNYGKTNKLIYVVKAYNIWCFYRDIITEIKVDSTIHPEKRDNEK